MATTMFQRPIRPRKEDEDVEAPSIATEQEETLSTSSHDRDASLDPRNGSDPEADPENHDEDTDADSEEEPEDLKDISFGALAKAQEAFVPNTRKRKLRESSAVPDDDLEMQPRSTGPDSGDAPVIGRRKITTAPGRTSKHAPAVQSSRHAVSRRRDIFEPSASLKSRDPRFDPTVTTSDTNPSAAEKANRNYSFLSSYQASEILDLKTQIKKSKDPDAIAKLKQQVMSLDSKMRVAEAQQRERDIIRRHKQKEKEAIKSGQKSKPYFLKRSDIKREALAERFEGMGKKARVKALERKRKRIKGKESKGMPRVRRVRLHEGN